MTIGNKFGVQQSKKLLYQSDLGLDLDQMTLTLKLDLNMVEMYHHTKNEVSMSRHSKVIAEQTHRQKCHGIICRLCDYSHS